MVPTRWSQNAPLRPSLAVSAPVRYGAAMAKLAAQGLIAAAVVAVFMAVSAPPAEAINLTQAEAAMPVLTADPHQGPGEGVVNADTKEPTEAVGGNNVVLLIAALGVLIGILLITRPRRGPQ